MNAADEEFKNSALHYASKRGNIGIAKLLLGHPQIDVNLSAKQGYTPLFLACQENHPDMVSLLLSHPAIDVNKQGPLGTAPLAIACHLGLENIVAMLLRHRFQGSGSDEEGGGDRGVEIDGGEPSEAGKLLEGMADINIPNSNGATAFFMACQAGQINIVKWLLRTGRADYCRPKADGATPLYIVAEKGHLEILGLLLSLPKVEVNQAKNGGFTPLYVASQEGHTEVTQALINHPKIAVNQESLAGATPLCVASYSGRLPGVKLLLADERVEVNKARADGATPLWVAAEKGHKNIVLWLLGSGRDVDASLRTVAGNSSWNSKTASEWAKQCDYPEVGQIIETFLSDPVKERANLRQQLGIEFDAMEKLLDLPNISIYQVKPLHFKSYTEISRLSLTNLGLTTLSPHIGTFSFLSFIIIIIIIDLSSSLFLVVFAVKFTGLVTLNLSDNKLTELPPGVLELPALKILTLQSTQASSSFLFYFHRLTFSVFRRQQV